MSDTPPSSENVTQPAAPVETIDELLHEPVAPATPSAPVKRAPHSEKHTAQNTPMQDTQPSVSEIIRDLTEADRDAKGTINIFLGNSKESQIYAGEVVSRWLAVEMVRNRYKMDQSTKAQLEKAEQDWEEYISLNMPNKTAEEAGHFAADLYQFATETQDGIRIRTKMMGEDGVSNVSDRGGFVQPDIIGKKAGAKIENFSLSQMMTRTQSNNTGASLQWTILLRNSFVALNLERPSKAEMGILLNDIRRSIGGYVREIGNNNLTLAATAARRVIWNYLCKNMASSSVTDIGEYGQLTEVILGVDLDILIIGLLKAYTETGVQHYLGCLKKGCDWGQYALVDPALMVRHRDKITSPEDHAIYANLLNGHLKMTREETLALSRASTYGVENNRVYDSSGTTYMEMAPGTLRDEFNAFDYFVSQVNPRLAELRQTITDPQEYQAELAITYANLGGTEFIQWIHAYVKPAPADSDAKEVRFVRDGTNDDEFNKGLIKLLEDDQEWNKAIVSFVLNKVPYMSRTFVGVRNYACPKCKTNTADTQDPQGLLDNKLGYTPINVVYSFFIHTQLEWMAMASALEEHKQKALS